MSGDALDLEGPAAPPRRNGELVFEAPWQSRLFGVTVSLARAGLFEWEEFRRHLIDEVRRGDAEPDDAAAGYWSQWRAALEKLLASTELCPRQELARRVETLAARPHGHDH